MMTIINLIKEILEPGNYTTMQVLRQFKDTQPKSWQQLEATVKVSTATLSKTLNALVERGVLKKQVIVGFPPRTQYMLNPTLDKDVYNFLAFQAKYMDQIENYAQTFLDLATQYIKEGNYAEFVNLAIKQYQAHLLVEVKNPILKLERWHDLLVVERAYVLLLDYFTLVQALTVDAKI
jgi:DNA-binding HxlR family transcriptional regulator